MFACGRSVTDRQLSIFNNYLCVCIICTNIISLRSTVPFYAAQPCFCAAQPFFLAEQPCFFAAEPYFFAAQPCFLAAQAHIHAAESHLLAAQPHFHAAEVALTGHRKESSSRSDAQNRKREMKKTSSLYRLDPFLDEKEVLRVGGRLTHASTPYHVKHPMILPRKGHHAALVSSLRL